MEQDKTPGETKKYSFIERLAERLSLTANAATIYGEPIEREGTTVIPVAKASYGFGGGSGTKAGDEGMGGGGGVTLTPVGFIEISAGNTRFKPIRDPQNVLKIIAVSGFFTFLTVRTVLKFIKK
ncbi:GerW family sporulation protein [Pontibacter locisalis]|uniref:GerW family sporulation protein n=1 Tax=Pontibacter locisalis TaxID=1719035 RepID=A0ABW5IGL0_9BACT